VSAQGNFANPTFRSASKWDQNLFVKFSFIPAGGRRVFLLVDRIGLEPPKQGSVPGVRGSTNGGTATRRMLLSATQANLSDVLQPQKCHPSDLCAVPFIKVP
jgi:hypothetical protein